MSETTVAPDAIITGGTSIGARSRIGSGVVIDDCIIGDDVTIESGVHLDRSFVAHGTTVVAGTRKSAHYLSKKLDLPISL
jgi:mannose-1-phosphate guanylyltransferase